MNDQHMKSRKRSVLRVLSVVLLMLVVTVFTLAVSVFADGATPAKKTLTVGREDLTVTGLEWQTDRYIKTYNGRTDDVTVALAANASIEGITAGDDVQLSIVSAVLSSANVGDCKLIITTALAGANADQYEAPELNFDVTIKESAQGVFLIEKDDLTITGLEWKNGSFTKTYDGTSTVNVSLLSTMDQIGLKDRNGDGQPDKVELGFNAYLTSAEAGKCDFVIETTLSGEDAYLYAQPATLRFPAVIDPVVWEWKTEPNAADPSVNDPAKVQISITYDPNATSYKLTPAQVQALLPDVVANDPALADKLVATVTSVQELSQVNVGTYTVTAYVSLEPAEPTDPDGLKGNYVIADIPVEITVTPFVIEDLVWGGLTKWTYGSAVPVTLTAVSGSNSYTVVDITCEDANYAAGNAGTYTLVARINDSNYQFSDSLELSKKSITVTIDPQVYQIDAVEGVTVIGDEQTVYNISVKGNIPTDVLKQFTYTVNGLPFGGTFQYGTFEVSVTTPSGNYVFYNKDGQRITEPLKATLIIKRQQLLVPVYNEAGEKVGSVILVNKNGFSENVVAKVTAVPAYPNITKNNQYTQAYKLLVTGAAEGDVFSVVFPIVDELLISGNQKLTLDDLCIYESANNSLVPASQSAFGYTVTLGEGYYQVDNFVPTETEITFVIAPDFRAPFFTTVPGILLIILIILIILLAMFYIGLILRRKMENEETEVVVVDAVEEEPVEEPVEESTADEDLDALAETATEEEAPVDEEAVEEAVEEALEDLDESLAEEPTEPTDEAVETLAVVDEDSEDDEEDDEDDDDDAFAFAADADPSTFIDVKENPEAYAAMLERERLGEIRIVSRYRKSFTAKMAQSLGNVQDYYSEIKNTLLAYKGVKSRISWNYDAFNKGRVHVAKIIAKSRTLYVYLALDPQDFADTKYNVVDVSNKKKYATTPVLMKIKGDRKFKHTLELIEKLCSEQLELKHLDIETVDYKVDRMTIDELVDAGYIKHLAGYILLVPEVVDETIADEAVADEAVADEAVADEAVAAEATADETTTDDTQV